MEVANITNVKGIRCWGAHIGIKSKRRDLALIHSEVPANTSAVFTTNKVVAEPVKLAREKLKRLGKAQAIVVNAGNANACTGEQGKHGAMAMASTTGDLLEIDKDLVQVASTGVIGRRFPTEDVVKGIKENIEKLSDRNIAGSLTANAILTTDTFSKEGHQSFGIHGKEVNMAGIAKGSGMIHPNMATMLAFIVCDVNIDRDLMDRTFKDVVDKTFNMITVDGDTSTNDEALLLCNGLAGNTFIQSEDDEGYEEFREKLHHLCQHLAKLIISDGEGATKIIEYKVVNAPTPEDAKKVVRTVSNSNLVKTAIYGRDPNWGRIIAAAGRSGAEVIQENFDLFVGSEDQLFQVARSGKGTSQDLNEVSETFRSSHVRIVIDLNNGEAESMGWGADLTPEYVEFNSSYTT